MKPFQHAKCHAKRWGGTWQQYVHLDDWLDQTKAIFPDMRHRAILHSAFGIFLCEDKFGHVIQVETESGIRDVSVRDIAEAHVLEDLGFIPTVQDYLSELPFYSWLGGKVKEKRKIEISESSLTIEELKQKMAEFNSEMKTIAKSNNEFDNVRNNILD